MMTIIAAWLSISLGYLSFRYTGKQWGHIACLAGSLLLTWEAIPRPDARPAPVAARGPSLVSQASAAEPRTPFVGSAIGKTYHRPGCFYVTKQLHHLVEFKSREDAESQGRKPCTNCLTSLASASAVRTDSPPATLSGP